jgi:hypothetical protein
MQPICHFTASSLTTNESLSSLVGMLHEIKLKLPNTKIISVSICPEMQLPSLRAPNGQMVYVAVAVLQMDSEHDLKELSIQPFFTKDSKMRLVE